MRERLWLVAATLIFGALDLVVHGLSSPVLLTVDVSLLFLARFPTAVALWAAAVAVFMLVTGTPWALPFATPAITTNLVRLVDRRRAFVLIGVLAVLGTRLWDPSWDITPLGLVNTVLPALTVLYLRARRELVAEQARAEERRRLAEEMHDIVTHRVSLMVLHAGALGTVSTDPGVRTAAEDIRRTGVQALAELRDLVGVLHEARAAPPEEPVAPDPKTLVDEARAVGEKVIYHADGDPERISPTVRRTAYRVVQESLTNARKHAPGAEVTVTLSYRADGVDVHVTNDTASRPPDTTLAGSGSGVGLAGLTQRVELVGGTLHAGPRPGGGYQVDATLPTGRDAR